MSFELAVGFLGAGKMASALANGFVKTNLLHAARICASDPVEAARASFGREVGATATSSNLDVVRRATVLILAVKPNQVNDVLAEIRTEFGENHLLISIAAGVRLSALEAQLPAGARVIRVMPNTPALVGQSASAFAGGKAARAEDLDLAEKLFGAVGLTCRVKEEWMDAVTGLSGSGPAYVYLVIEALSDGGVAAGLPRDVATRLAAQTVLGAARMVLETNEHPGKLKEMVTSPGGTTIEGLHELERSGVRGAFMDAVRAASDKSRKLGQ